MGFSGAGHSSLLCMYRDCSSRLLCLELVPVSQPVALGHAEVCGKKFAIGGCGEDKTWHHLVVWQREMGHTGNVKLAVRVGEAVGPF